MQCNAGDDLINARCYAPCPPGTTTSRFTCVSSLPCPGNTYIDATDSSLCVKVVYPLVNLLCESGFTQWFPGACYVNCPPGFTEAGNVCIKRSYDRTVNDPYCSSSWETFRSDARGCVWTNFTWGFTIIVMIVILVALYYALLDYY